jgi:hypothetical protein
MTYAAARAAAVRTTVVRATVTVVHSVFFKTCTGAMAGAAGTNTI